MRSSERIATVIGGAGTIGAACARRFAEHRLLLADHDEDALAASADRLRADGLRLETAVCDVTDPASVARLASHAERLGPLAALVNAAGLSGAQADGRTIMAVNLLGTLLVLDAFEPLATEGTAGVMIASVSGHRRFAQHYDSVLVEARASDVMERLEAAGAFELHPRACYSISKRGIILHTQIRAAAWGRLGGRLVSVSPGLIGDSTMGALVGEAKNYADRSALGRTGRNAEVAAVVAFACSSEAAYVTGTDIVVDGGTLAGTNWEIEREASIRWHAPPAIA
jgi:NAD(P)-dependent dehydrogenase (short-subunit alcohol dehydrogenase family)